MSSISSVSNLNVVILMKVHLPVHLPRHSTALWISGGRDRRCLFSSARQCLPVVRNKKLIGIRELLGFWFFLFFPEQSQYTRRSHFQGKVTCTLRLSGRTAGLLLMLGMHLTLGGDGGNSPPKAERCAAALRHWCKCHGSPRE